MGNKEWIADLESLEDLLMQPEIQTDRRLQSVYVNTVHRNNGHHLRGGSMWRQTTIAWTGSIALCHTDTSCIPPPPRNAVGKRFVRLFVEL